MTRALQRRLLNTLQSLLLLGGMAALAGYLGWFLFGPEGIAWAIAAAVLAIAFTPRFSPRWVLRLSGAWEIAPWQAPELYEIVAALAERAGLPRVPRLFYVPTRVLNAFASGSREDSAIALTDGLLRALDTREIAGVLAHEVSHVRANDIWVMTLADVVGRLTAALSFAAQIALVALLPASLLGGYRVPLLPFALVILAPLAALALQLALSRTREYDADLAAVELTGDPHGLASALDKLERLQGGWIERMFMAGGGIPKWLRTHPSTRERVRRLLALEPASASGPWFGAPRPRGPLYELPVVVRRPRWHWNGLWY
jgi:heat shock protein HtpX